jgi:hypothetical protein
VHQFVTTLLTDAQISGISMSALRKQGLEFIHPPSQYRSDQPALALNNDATDKVAPPSAAENGGPEASMSSVLAVAIADPAGRTTRGAQNTFVPDRWEIVHVG